MSSKNIIITGASQGIGRAIAQAFASQGDHVICIARSENQLQELCDQIRDGGGSAEFFTCDLADPLKIETTLHSVLAKHPRIHVLVNNAGVGTFKDIDQCSTSEVSLPVAVPFAAGLHLTRLLVPHFKQQGGGQILNLTSPAGYLHLPGMVPYGASRHAVNAMSLALREELAPYKIGVSLICPAQVDTGYFERNDTDVGRFPKAAKMFPVLQPEQVAKRVVKAAKTNPREDIFPMVLRIFVRWYQMFPRTTVAMLKLAGMYKPSV